MQSLNRHILVEGRAELRVACASLTLNDVLPDTDFLFLPMEVRSFVERHTFKEISIAEYKFRSAGTGVHYFHFTARHHNPRAVEWRFDVVGCRFGFKLHGIKIKLLCFPFWVWVVSSVHRFLLLLRRTTTCWILTVRNYSPMVVVWIGSGHGNVKWSAENNWVRIGKVEWQTDALCTALLVHRASAIRVDSRPRGRCRGKSPKLLSREHH